MRPEESLLVAAHGVIFVGLPGEFANGPAILQSMLQKYRPGISWRCALCNLA